MSDGVRIAESGTEPSPLGRRLVHDPRSRGYAVTAPVLTGESVRHRFDAPNLDQFYTSACVGFSGANMLNCAVAARSRKQFNRHTTSRYVNHYLDNGDGLNNYSESTERDPFDWVYPPTDEGSSALGLMKYWHEIGIISEYRWAFDFEAFLAALQRQPVLVGTNWYRGMSTPDTAGRVYPHGEHIGGHEYLATAILWDDRLISFENSWGERWGLRGRFYMTFADVRRLLAEGGDVACPVFL